VTQLTRSPSKPVRLKHRTTERQPASKLLRAEELAARLDVSPDFVYKAAARGGGHSQVPKVPLTGRMGRGHVVRFSWPAVCRARGIDGS
jgi:hypothetical protein